MNETQLLIIPSEHWEAHYIAECYLMAPGQPLKDMFSPWCVLRNTTAVKYIIIIIQPYIDLTWVALVQIFFILVLLPIPS